jgi:hypothetical protein
MSSRFARLLAAPIAALGLVAGAFAVAAPAASASITPDCVWQSLYLVNGWQSAQGNWNTGDPEFCLDNGTVYLSGSLKNPVAGGFEFAALPPRALPTSNLVLAVYTYGGSVGQLTILSDGKMYATGGNASQYTSLAGISFPVAGTALTPLNLKPLDTTPNWQSAQSQYGTGDPGYVVTDGIAHWTGSMTAVSNPNANYDFVTDTPGAVPDSCFDFNVYTYGDHVGDLQIWPGTTSHPSDYGMHVSGTGSATLTSLAGVSFPVQGHAAWQALNLQDGWAPYDGGPSDYLPSCAAAFTPSYYIQDHIVYLTGEIAQYPVGNAFIGTLPATARPQHDLYLIVWGGDSTEYLHISPNGNMNVWGYPYQNGQNVISLANVSYQTSS